MSSDAKPGLAEPEALPKGVQDPGELWHISLNDDAPETIVLIHGSTSSHAEWTFVWPHLSPYHLLIPDMNGHSNSRDVTPVTLEAQAARVAALIKSHAHGGTAHVVGLSMGGFVANETSSTYPTLVRSVFATGCAPFTGWRLWAAEHPGVSRAVMNIGNVVPGWVSDKIHEAVWARQGVTVPDVLREHVRENTSRAVTVLAHIGKVKMENMREITVRTLAVAGGKMDDVPATKAQGEALREGCAASRAVVVRKATHAWDLQFPELFAQGILAWIQERELPGEFESLA